MDMTETIEKLPIQIKELSLKIFEDTNKLEALNLQKALTKNEVTQSVIDAIDSETGKPIFSNEQKRTIEIERRLNMIPDYININDKAKELKEKLKLSEIELDFLRNTFRSIETISRLKI